MAIGKIQTQLTELNFNLVWAQVNPDHKSTFRNIPVKVKLAPNFMLYKFTDAFFPAEGWITPWWCPVDPYLFDAGLSARLNLARHLGASPADLARVVAAVAENWNAMTYLLKAQLLTPVYGFWGQCIKQPRLEEGKTPKPGIPRPPEREDLSVPLPGSIPGTAWQFYIPNLTHKHIREVSRESVANLR
jgi:hypothetical protein